MDFNFSILSMACLLVCIAFFLGGLVDATCGGGGLVIVPGLLAIGMPAHMAVGTNQFSAIFGTVTALYKYNQSGNVKWKIAFMSAPFALVGAMLGARLNLLISEHYLQLVMMILMPVLVVFSLVNKVAGEEDKSDELSTARLFAAAALIGLFVGGYHAFYGPASGMFFVITYTFFCKLDFLKANGIARFELIVANIVAGSTYAFNDNMCWQAIIPATLAYILGNYIGASIAISKGSKFIRPVYYCVLVMLFIKLIYDFMF